MRPLEIYAFLGLAGVLVLMWLGWLIMRGVPGWVPLGATGLVVLLLMMRIVLISVRQD